MQNILVKYPDKRFSFDILQLIIHGSRQHHPTMLTRPNHLSLSHQVIWACSISDLLEQMGGDSVQSELWDHREHIDRHSHTPCLA